MTAKKKAEKDAPERYGVKISGDGPVAKAKADLSADTKTPEQVGTKAEKKSDA